MSTHSIRAVFWLLVMLAVAPGRAQETPAEDKFSRQDRLRGSITPERAWWDLLKYELHVSVDPEKKSIEGSNVIHFRVLKNGQRMQVDLPEGLT